MGRAIRVPRRIAVVAAASSGLSVRAAAQKAGVSSNAAAHWAARFKATGDVVERPRSGRPRAISVKAARKAVEMLKSNSHGGVAGVARALYDEGFTAKLLHRTTVLRAAKAQAVEDGHPIVALVGKPAKQLTAANKAKRLAFALANRTRAWGKVLFTDRKKFLFRYPGTAVQAVTWVERGKGRRQALYAGHAHAVNVYAGISKHGVTACHVVSGTKGHKGAYNNKMGKAAKNITAGEYKDVLTQTLLPEGERLMRGAGVRSWVFQQDNDPTHKDAAALIEKYNRVSRYPIEFLGDWPPNSPDLNLIENVWAWVQGRVDKLGCKTFDAFKAAVLQEVEAVPQRLLTPLYASMAKRIEETIRLDGDKTKY
jgi:transposase